MYNVAANFHTLAIQDAPKTRVRIYFIGDAVDCTDDNDVQTNGTLLVGAAGDTDSNGRIAEGGITFQEFFNPEKNVMIGDCVSSQIEMTLLNFDGALDGFAFGRCKVYLDVYDSANSAWLPCPMGVYIIEQPTKTRQKLIVANGFDQMQKLDASADSWWNSIDWSVGVSFLQMINSVAAAVGVSVSTNTASAIENSSATFNFAVTDCNNVTFRQVLGLIGEATATTARFDRDGALDMRWFKAAQISGNTVQIDTDTVGNQCLSIDIAEYSVAQYGRLKYKIGSFSASAGIGNGDNIYYIVDNPFLNPQIGESVGMPLSDGISKVYQKIHAIGAYTPIQGRFITDWSIESGDIINIVRNSTTYSMPIYQQKMIWRGGFVVSDASNDGDAIRPESATRTNDAFPVYSSATSRSEKKLSSTGWYRAIRLNYALDNVANLSGRTCAVIDINIISQKHENHTIQFRQRPGWGEFCNETSLNQPPNNTVIDKIRYIYDSGGTYESEGYIDIHFSGNSSSDVSVFYNAFVRSDLLNATFPCGLEPVADIPVNEQLQNEYTFSDNGFVQSINSYFNAASRFNAATYFNAGATFNNGINILARTSFAEFSISGGSNANVSLPNGSKALIVLCGGGNTKEMVIANATTAGTVTYMSVTGNGNFTYTTSTRTLNIANGATVVAQGIVIYF